jgi:multiple sugar transport system permease protein
VTAREEAAAVAVEVETRQAPLPELPRDAVPVRPPKVTSGRVVSNVTLVILGVLFIAPLIWLIFDSIDSQASQTLEWPHFTFGNFTAAANSANMLALKNSVIISLIATVIATVPATLAGYVFSRRHIPFKGPLLLGILMLAGVPMSILIVPIYQLFAGRNYLALVPAAIFLGVTSLPFELWIIKNFMDAVPIDLEESARLERAGTTQILTRVVVPLTLPGIGAAAIFGFINAWGNFLVPLVLISNASQQPAPVAMYGFFGGNVIRWGEIAAYSVMYSVPVLILYLALSRLFRGGFVLSGAIRG